jgi:RHH-type rel operon transcriptional repressor/antitoxin RelB
MTGKRRVKPAGRKAKPAGARSGSTRVQRGAEAAPAFASLRIGGRLDAALDRLVERTGRPKSYHVRKALEQHIEDTHDYLDAEEAIKEWKAGGCKSISLDELKKQLGVAD